MQHVPFINDYWQFRLNRHAEASEDEAILSLCDDFWKTHRQDTRRLVIDEIELELHTFEKGLVHTDAFIDIAITPQPFMHKYRLLAGHAALRSALVDANHRKVVAVLPGNMRELRREQVGRICDGIVEWFEQVDHLYLAPFAQSADMFRNWLKGVYTGGTPAGERPSLFALEHVLADRRSLTIETANALIMALESLDHLTEKSSIAVHGAGLWAESVAVTLDINGFNSRQILEDRIDTEADVLMFVDSGLSIGKATEVDIRDKIVIELGPDQIDPAADQALKDNNNLVIGDMLCGCSEDLVEKWLLAGSGVDSWQHYLQIEHKALLEEYLNLMSDRKLNHADAMLSLALKRLNRALF